MRKRTVFADLVALAMDPRPLRKQLFVVGVLPGRFLNGSRSPAQRVLERSQQSLRERFAEAYGTQAISVADFRMGPACDVEIVDLLQLLPQLRSALTP